MAFWPRVQRVGAQAVTGAFRTVATAVVEAEDSLRSVIARPSSKSTLFWVNTKTQPPSYPLTMVRIRRCRRFASPPQKIPHENKAPQVQGLETIKPYTIPPWEDRLNPEVLGQDSWSALLGSPGSMVIMTSSAEREGLVGSRGATYDSSGAMPGNVVTMHETVIGPRAHHQAELVAINLALKGFPTGLRA